MSKDQQGKTVEVEASLVLTEEGSCVESHWEWRLLYLRINDQALAVLVVASSLACQSGDPDRCLLFL